MTPEARILSRLKSAARLRGLRLVRLALMPGVEVGWPDTIIAGPGGRTLWVETKAPGKPLRPMQAHRRDALLALGQLYAKIDGVEQIDGALAVLDA